jgi:signal transduction histidine kinase
MTSRNTPTAFVIDDDTEVRMSSRGLLKAAGLHFRPFATAEEYLRNEAPDGPSCLVLDVSLPGVDGLEPQRKLADAGMRIPTIFITGQHGAIPMTVKAIKSGAVEFSCSQQVEAVLGIGHDLTERTLAAEALRQAQSDLAHASRMTTMGELTASLAHEVNQPITATVNGASTCMRWLTRDDPDLGEAREAALGVVRNAKRAADTINHIRSISKKSESQRQWIDINEVAREIISLLRNEAHRYSIAILTNLDADLPKVMADSVHLQQVIMNLIMNRFDAMKNVDRARELVIRSGKAADQYLMISVSDSGVGLPSDQANQIFDAFFTTKSHGPGMGLRISRSIVESHGGRLWAADNSPHGASFSFTLPIPVDASEPPAKPSDSHTNV